MGRISTALRRLQENFWLLPAAMVVLGLAGAETTVDVERAGLAPHWLLNGWVYGGGESGARTLLGAVASSTIGVAGTTFSITIASLTLASSQMGPRLLKNFTKDRGNQATLGLFLATFGFALTTLRTVRSPSEGAFVPHLATTVAILLAFGCVAMLVYFVHHMSGRINVDTVVHLVQRDLVRAIGRLTLDHPAPAPDVSPFITQVRVADQRSGYLQEVDDGAFADFAARHELQLRLLARPGDFIFPGSIVLEASRSAPGLPELLRRASVVGRDRSDAADLEYSVRQLADIAVRALSPGINDPQTAVSVLDHMGAGLAKLAARHLPSGVAMRGSRIAFQRTAVTYDGLVDAMLHPIRSNADGSPAVLIRMMEVLAAVAGVERRLDRLPTLERHANLVLETGQRDLEEPAAMQDLRARHFAFLRLLEESRLRP